MLENFKDSFKKCINKTEPLIFDEACLDIISNSTEPLIIGGKYEECYLCDTQEITTIPPLGNTSILINTKYAFEVNFKDSQYEWCNTIYQYNEHGVYGWNISNRSCSYIYIKEAPDNAYLPILGAFIVFLLFGTIWYGIKCIYRSGCTSGIRNRLARFSELENDLGTPQVAPPTTVPSSHRRHSFGRVKSIDVFRGLCITVMIFVNYGGGQYSFFKHSIWNGLTIADIVFPWFAWIMGVSIALSLRSSLRAGVSRKTLLWKAFSRAFFLFVIGISLNTISSHSMKEALTKTLESTGIWKADQWGTEQSEQIRNPVGLHGLRIPGVLQRLAISGFVVSVLEIVFMEVQTQHQYGYFNFLSDVLECWKQWIVVIVLIIIHTCITFLLPVPECPTGYLGPGGYHQRSTHFECTGGAAGYIDREILGPSHLYQNPSFKKMYQTDVPYDPEGILGTLTTILIVYLGVQAGRIMLTYNEPKSRIVRWMSWAVVIGLAAGIMCNFSKNNGHIPINKNLWSLSYVLATGCMAFIFLSIVYLQVDVTKYWGGRPLFYPGMNPITLYIGHTLTKNMFPWSWEPAYWNHREFLVMNLWGTFVWIAISIFLYKRKIILKL